MTLTSAIFLFLITAFSHAGDSASQTVTVTTMPPPPLEPDPEEVMRMLEETGDLSQPVPVDLGLNRTWSDELARQARVSGEIVQPPSADPVADGCNCPCVHDDQELRTVREELIRDMDQNVIPHVLRVAEEEREIRQATVHYEESTNTIVYTISAL